MQKRYNNRDKSEDIMTTYQKLRYTKCVFEQSVNTKRKSMIHLHSILVRNKKISLYFLSSAHMIDYNINIRAMLSCYYLRTGLGNISQVSSLFGISGGHGWMATFYMHVEAVNHKIMIVCANTQIMVCNLNYQLPSVCNYKT